jgi:hypothetical protein
MLIANHPYGILDGLMMGHILSMCGAISASWPTGSSARPRTSTGDPAHLLRRDAEAVALNLETRKIALPISRKAGRSASFRAAPSPPRHALRAPMDPGWRAFTAKMIARSRRRRWSRSSSKANSRLFQIASHLHSTLRMALLIKEFRRASTNPSAS